MIEKACIPARGARLALAVGLALGLIYCATVPGPASADQWKFEVVRDKQGKTFLGLVLRESPGEILFQCVIRKPGERTRLITTTFTRAEVDRVERLSMAEHEQLAARLRAIESSVQDEKERMERIELRPAPWGPSSDGGWAYRSEHFLLVSNARPEIVRRTAVRLDQLYAAFTRLLPPRRISGRPTTIRLVQSRAEYQALQREQGRELLNPAYYDAAHNQIVWGSDLQDLGDELERVRKQHADLRERLHQQEDNLKDQYKGKIPRDLLKPIRAAREKIGETDRENQKHFEKATKRFFQILYHEAFHAYLANYVFAAEEAEVPHWLNEGLAQVFETAILEAGDLRIDHADPERLAAVKAGLAKGELVALADLLTAGHRQFVVAHASEQQVSDRYYLASWALAFYLTAERNKLSTPELERYVAACKRSGDPVSAFRAWVGQALEAFEKEFHQYLLHLRNNGIPR